MGTALHHIALVCRDPEETHRFYGEHLGFRLVCTEVQTGQPESFDTAISTGLGLPAWVNHIALRRSLDELPAIKARLEEHGVAPTMEIDHGWCTSLYYTDPNGNMIEFCADTSGMPVDEDEARRLLTSLPADAT